MLTIAVAMLGTAAPSLMAQATGTVRGTVVEAGTQRPLQGARIAIEGTSAAALTNAAGEYTIQGVPAGPVRLQVQLLGYRTTTGTATVGNGVTARADFALSVEAVGLDQIVVTGTAGAVSRRSVGNAIVKLDAEEITAKTTVSNVAEILQSRTPGVQILSNAGTPGAAPDIRVRGAGSLTAVRPIISSTVYGTTTRALATLPQLVRGRSPTTASRPLPLFPSSTRRISSPLR
jgi:hypothetical protein